MKYPVFWCLIGNFFIWFCIIASVWGIFFKPLTPEPSFRYKVEPLKHSQTFAF